MKKQRIIIIVTFICTVLASCTYLLVPLTNIKSADEFSDLLDQKVNVLLSKYDTPGVAIALIENGEIAFINTYGYSNTDTKTPITEDSLFQMASISKPFTAWGIMNLVEEGSINLDDPIETYITSWQLPDSEFNSEGVTVRRLLSHTGGLTLSGYYGIPYDEPVQNIQESLDNPVDAKEPVSIVIQPGTRFRYSGGGITLLQLLIEEVSGIPFAEYMQQEVIEPLGMTNTTFKDVEIDSYVIPYDEKMNAVEPLHFTALAAAGLSSTPKDMAKWILATTKDKDGNIDNPVLSENTVQSMMIETPLENSKNLLEKLSGGFGLGYSVEPILLRDKFIYTHTGHNPPGWRNIIAIDEAFETGIVVLTNGANGYKVYAQILDYFTNYTSGGTNLTSIYNVRLPKILIPSLTILSVLIAMFIATFSPSVKKKFGR